MAQMLSKPPCACHPRIVGGHQGSYYLHPSNCTISNIGAIFLPNQLAQTLIQAVHESLAE